MYECVQYCCKLKLFDTITPLCTSSYSLRRRVANLRLRIMRKGTVSWDWYPSFFIILPHLGPLFICWSILAYSLDSEEICICMCKNPAVSLTSQSQTQKWQWHRGLKNVFYIFVNDFFQFKETISGNFCYCHAHDSKSFGP